jgi:hypothetical protein
MSFSGELNDHTVAELLIAVADSKKSGKLRLTHRRGQGVVLFDRGLVGYAGSNSLRETFGSILVAEKHITERQLERALDLQRAMGKKPLGSVLAELGVISKAVINSTVRLQVRRALTDLLGWDGAHFEFQPMEVAGGGYVSLPLAEVLPGGAKKVTGGVADLSEQLRETKAEPPQSEDTGSRQALLGRMAAEVRSPAFTGEMVTRVLGLASHVVRRAVLFLCRPDGFCGIGQSGIEIPGGQVDEAVRSLVIAHDRPSLLKEVYETRSTVKRALADSGSEALLVDALGGSIPMEGVAGPITVNDRVMMILYGDNLPEKEPVGSILELNLLLIQAGMSVENNLLQKRIQHYETLRGSTG